MTLALLVSLCTAPFSFWPAAGSLAPEGTELRGLAERWDEARQTLHVPGLAVVVVRGGEVVLLETFGQRDVLRGEPVTAETAFYIASVTKTYVALALLSLAEEGVLGLDVRVRDYLPRFATADPELDEELTVRDLLTHAKGLTCHPCVMLDAYTGEITEDRYYHHLSESRPSGTVEYTNVHYTLAGRVLEALTGHPWRDELRRRLFEPLGMGQTTGYADEMYAREDVAFPTQWTGERFQFDPVRKTDRTMHAAGGLGTSAHDAGRYLLLLTGGGTLEGRTVVSAAGIEELLLPQTEMPPRRTGATTLDAFGLAWMLGDWNGRPVAQHGGGYSGAAALFSLLPEERIGVAVLANTDRTGHALCDLINEDVFASLLGEPLSDWRPQAQRVLERQAEELAFAASDARVPGAPGRLDPAHAEDGLTLPPSAYVGRYENEHWGTLAVTLDDGRLVLRLGDLPLEAVSTERDSFRLVSPIDEAGRFVVSGERVEALEVELALHDTAVLFPRAER